MKLEVTAQALAVFQQEWNFVSGDQVRIFVRYSGGGADAFAFGIIKDEPIRPGISTVKEGITFYMEENDVWYLEGKSLTLDTNNKEDIMFQLVEE